MYPTYICDNHKFYWKASIHASLIDVLKKCDVCAGTGKLSTLFRRYDSEDDLICKQCNGRGHESWYEPWIEKDVVDYLQKQLDKYLIEREEWKKENPEFIGMGI